MSTRETNAFHKECSESRLSTYSNPPSKQRVRAEPHQNIEHAVVRVAVGTTHARNVRSTHACSFVRYTKYTVKGGRAEMPAFGQWPIVNQPSATGSVLRHAVKRCIYDECAPSDVCLRLAFTLCICCSM